MYREPESETPADFGRRVRRWRDRQGLTLAQLAARSDLSIGYLSLLERGLKVPSPAAAARLARALGDDESLYRSWAAALRAGVTTARVTALTADAMPSLSFDEVESVSRASPAPATWSGRQESANRLSETTYRPSETPYPPASDVVAVRVLPPHADPSDPKTYSARPLLLDRRFLGAEPGDRLFAYEMTPDASALAGDVAATGDHLVFSSRVTRITPSRVYAVRRGNAIVIARLSVIGEHLVIVPPAGEADVETIPGDWREVVRGVAVVVIRRLLPARPSSERPPRPGHLAGLDDLELVGRIPDGDADAARELNRRYGATIRRAIGHSSLTTNAQAALGRAVWDKLRAGDWQVLRRWNGAGSLLPYLARVVRWTFNDHARHARGLPPGTTDFAGEDTLDALPEGALGPLEILRDRERMKAIERVVGALNPRDQEVLYRRYVFGEPNAAIAGTLGIALTTLHVALSRARARFETASRMEKEDGRLRSLLDRMGSAG